MTNVSFISFQIKAGTLWSPTKLFQSVEWISLLWCVGRKATHRVTDYTLLAGKEMLYKFGVKNCLQTCGADELKSEIKN